MYETAKETLMYRSLMDSVGEGEGGKIWEIGIETCKISCMKQVASPGSMHDTGFLGLVHWDDPEEWYGEGGGRRVQDGEHMKNILNQLLYIFLKSKEIKLKEIKQSVKISLTKYSSFLALILFQIYKNINSVSHPHLQMRS